jgi:hypothetical protein
MAFDHYQDRFSPLAGLIRWKERRAARRIGYLWSAHLCPRVRQTPDKANVA